MNHSAVLVTGQQLQALCLIYSSCEALRDVATCSGTSNQGMLDIKFVAVESMKCGAVEVFGLLRMVPYEMNFHSTRHFSWKQCETCSLPEFNH